VKRMTRRILFHIIDFLCFCSIPFLSELRIESRSIDEPATTHPNEPAAPPAPATATWAASLSGTHATIKSGERGLFVDVSRISLTKGTDTGVQGFLRLSQGVASKRSAATWPRLRLARLVVAVLLAVSFADVCDAAACFRSSATGCPPKLANAHFAATGQLELTLSWDAADASFAITSYSVIYLNEWYEQVVFDAALQTAFTFSSAGATSVDGQFIQAAKGAEFQVSVFATNGNGVGYYITPFLTAVALDLPSPPTDATLCSNRLLNEQYLCATSSSERLRWRAPPDLGAGDGVAVDILAFYVQSAATEGELDAAAVVLVEAASALQPAGVYQTDEAAGGVARVWLETAAGVSVAASAALSGSCTGELLVSSVLFGGADAARGWGVTGESDSVISLEITTGSLLPGAALLLLIFPDGFHFSADPEPVLTHRNTGVRGQRLRDMPSLFPSLPPTLPLFLARASVVDRARIVMLRGSMLPEFAPSQHLHMREIHGQSFQPSISSS